METPRITNDSTVVAGKQQVSRTIEDEAVILGLAEGVYYGLDDVGARIWQLVQEPRSVREICDAIVQEYDVDRAQCEHDVVALLERLSEEKLIEVSA